VVDAWLVRDRNNPDDYWDVQHHAWVSWRRATWWPTRAATEAWLALRALPDGVPVSAREVWLFALDRLLELAPW
jgi:hypothetical protein